MPWANVRDGLQPLPLPLWPPWWEVDVRLMSRLMQRSAQALTTWRYRGVGPVWRRDSAGRVYYQLAQIEAWLDQDTGPDAVAERIRAFLLANLGIVERGVGRLTGEGLVEGYRGLVQLKAQPGMISTTQLEALTSALDRGRVFGAPPFRAKLPWVKNHVRDTGIRRCWEENNAE